MRHQRRVEWRFDTKAFKAYKNLQIGIFRIWATVPSSLSMSVPLTINEPRATRTLNTGLPLGAVKCLA